MHIPYKTLILGSALLFTAALTTRPAFAGRCNSNGICTACSNCSACKNCSQNGGSCSVCRGTSTGRSSSSASSTFRSPSTNFQSPRVITRSTARTTTPSYTSANKIAAYARQQEAESRRQAAIRRQNQRELDAWYAKQPYTARCIAITDGDTIKVLRDNKQIRIRLYGIDAPEKAQAFGQQAKNALSAAAFNKSVKVFPKGTDRYGRTLAWIFVGDKCINRDLVAKGMAWHYVQYSPSEKKLAALHSQAKARKTGLWSMSATPPWAWRREH